MAAGILIVDTALLVLIWLVQTVIYPSFAEIEESRFAAFHRRYTTVISLFVIPLMFTQAGLYGIMVARSLVSAEPMTILLISTTMILFVWIVTFTLSVPCHRRLATDGNCAHTVRRLVRTNWFRTIPWTVVWAIGVVEIVR